MTNRTSEIFVQMGLAAVILGLYLMYLRHGHYQINWWLVICLMIVVMVISCLFIRRRKP